VVERIATANALPIDNIKGAPLVFRMTFDATLASKGRMQTARV
jgi:hypothetical protein